MIFLSTVFVSAETGLQNYPDLFVSNGKLSVVTVVGDKSASSNVLAQASISSSLADSGYEAYVKNKLSTEVDNLSQNIISVGNPCVNPISAEIMSNPQPCDKDFAKGKAYVKLYSKNEFYYIVVAGFSDVGTRKAANLFADYKNYQFTGNNVSINVEGETQEDAATLVGAPAQTTNSNANEGIVPDSKGNVEIVSEDTKTSISTNSEGDILPNSNNDSKENGNKEEITESSATQELGADVSINNGKKENIATRFFKWIFSWLK